MSKKESTDQSQSLDNVDATTNDEIQEFLQTLEHQRFWNGWHMYRYKGFWLPVFWMPRIISYERHFKAHETDIILASIPKGGTTWLKALVFCIVNRNRYSIDQSPLLTSNPHDLIPYFEMNLYAENENPDLESMISPRMFATHLPYEFISSHNCRIIFICRNPLDVYVSGLHFYPKVGEEDWAPLPPGEAFEMFCQGFQLAGPYWDHMLGYWKASLENPKKVLFLRYEDLKEDVSSNIKKIADFIGSPLLEEEEKDGLIDKISELCSLENLRSMEVNKVGVFDGKVPNSKFFRKGKVGDWANDLTPSMAERLERIMESKLKGSGLTFKTNEKVKA